MSKLFNTLEKISRNETVKVSTGVASKTVKPRYKFEKRQGAGIIILVVGVVILVYLLVPKSTNNNSTTQPITPTAIIQSTTETTTLTESAPHQTKSPAASREKVTGVEATTPEEEQKFVSLVNQGAELIEKRDYWRGLYLLNKAKVLQPDRLEPLVNSAVALAELGYRELAVSYLNQAEELAPGHPALKENRMILSQAGVEEAKR